MAERIRPLLATLLLAAAPWLHAGEARSVADDPALEARMMGIATELRCLVCQNQTVADSHSGLAGDLRQQIRDCAEALTSARRAIAVANYLITKEGLDPAKIFVKGLGKSKPVADNDTAAGRAQNRRFEILFLVNK